MEICDIYAPSYQSLNIKRELSGLPSVINFDGLFAAEDN